jgi:2'-5' RNA ligase
MHVLGIVQERAIWHPMHVVITLCMDASSSDRVASLQRLLAERGISDYANRLGYKPHLSLLRFDNLEPEVVLPIVSRLAANIPSLPISLEGVALFAGASPALWLVPVANTALLSLHSHLHAALAQHVAHDHYQPDHWMPHVTLAEGLDHAGATNAIAAILPVFSPIKGRLDKIEIVCFPPVTVIWSERAQGAHNS